MNTFLRRVAIGSVVLGVVIAAFFVLRPSAAERRATAKLLSIIHSDAGLDLYEGLPHPMFEAELYRSELGTKAVMRRDGHELYRERLKADLELEAQLRRICADANTYLPFAGEKDCGGFHADYALTWFNGKESVTIVLCFDCQEAWIHGRSLAVLTELSSSAALSLIDLMSRVPRNRPHPEDVLLEKRP
jgi:hypothetical protein